MESDRGPAPTIEQVEAEVRALCRSADLPEPDSVRDYGDGDYVALWDESRVALVVEVGREEL